MDGARACAACGGEVAEVAAFNDDGSAGTGTAQVTAAPVATSAERAARWGIDVDAARAAARDTAVALGAQLAFLFVVSALIGIALLPEGAHGNPLAWALAAVQLAGMSVRGALTVTATGGESAGSVTLFGSGFALYAVPLLGTVFGLGMVARVARRRETAEPSPDRRAVAGRALLTAAAYYAVLGALALLTRTRPAYEGGGESVTVSIGLGSLLAGCVVAVGGAAAAGRAGAIARRAGHPSLRAAALARAGSWAAAIRAAVTAMLLTSAGAALYVYVNEIVDAEGVADRLRGTLGFLLLLPNILLVAGGFAMGPTLGAEGSVGGGPGAGDESFGFGGAVGYGFLAGGVPGRYWPMLGIAVVAAVVAALRAAARSHPAERPGWYRPAVVLTALWLVAAFVTQVSATSEASGAVLGLRGSGAAHGRAGLGFPSMALCAAAFGTLVWAVQRFAAPNVAAAAPRAYARLGGAGTNVAWTAPEEGAAWRRDPRHSRAVLALLVAIVALLAAGGARAVSYVASAGSPENAARRYLDALADGDAARALAEADAGEREGANLLTEEALDAQLDAAPIREVRITGSEVDGDVATVSYRLDLGMTTLSGDLEMEKAGGGLVSRWKVSKAGGAARVRVPPGVGEVRINGAAVEVVGEEAVATVFPGVVVAVMAETGIYARDEARDYLREPTGGVRLSLEAELNPRAVDKVKAALDARARECAAIRTLEVPEQCPFDEPFAFGEVSDVRWTIVAPPSRDATVQLGFDGDVEVRGSMSLVVTYRENEIFGPGTNRREEVRSTFEATAAFSGDTVKIEFDYVF